MGKWIDRVVIVSVILMVLIFILWPFLGVMYEAFYYEGQLNLGHVWETIQESTGLIKNSLMLGISTTVLTTIVSLMMALAIYLLPQKTGRVITLILLVTMISPPFVTSLSFINLFGRRGLISYHVFGLRLNPYGFWGVLLMQTVGFISLHTLLIVSNLRAISHDAIKSAQDLGAGTNRVILDVLIPGLKPSILSVFFLSFIRSLADFGTPSIIGGNFRVLAMEGYQQVIARGNLNQAAVINLIIFMISILLFVGYYYFQKQTMNSAGHSGQSQIERRGSLYYLILAVTGFFIAWLILQYGSIILSAFTKMEQGQMIWTLDNFYQTLPYIDSATIRSIVYSLIAAVGGSLIGLLIAYYAIIRRSRMMRWMSTVANFPYILPGTFFGLGYLIAFNSPPLAITGTSAIVVLNVLFKQLPFSVRVMESSVTNIHQETINAARDLGAGYVDEFKDVVLPLTRQSLFVSFINAFTSTMTTVGSIIFLVYPGQKVLTLVMFDVINSGKYDIGSVIALIIIVICLIVSGLYYLLSQRGRKESAYVPVN